MAHVANLHATKQIEASSVDESWRIWPSDDLPARKQPLGDLFFANSVWVVSKRCADIIGKFDLGAGSLYPVQLLEDDRMTVTDTTYFCINFGNRITAILPDLSTGIRKTFNDYYRLKGVVNDDDIKLSAAAVSGPDLWIDPLLEGVLFLSDRLHAALSKAQVLKGFGDLKRCIVAQQN